MDEKRRKEFDAWLEIFPLNPAENNYITIIPGDPTKTQVWAHVFLVDGRNFILLNQLNKEFDKETARKAGAIKLGQYLVPSVERLETDFKKLQASYQPKKPKVHSQTLDAEKLQPYLDSYINAYEMGNRMGNTDKKKLSDFKNHLWGIYHAANDGPEIKGGSGEYNALRSNFYDALDASLKDAEAENRTKEQG